MLTWVSLDAKCISLGFKHSISLSNLSSLLDLSQNQNVSFSPDLEERKISLSEFVVASMKVRFIWGFPFWSHLLCSGPYLNCNIADFTLSIRELNCNSTKIPMLPEG